MFNGICLTDEENKTLILQHNGSLAKWVGELMHIRVCSRPDIAYATMRLSTYMSNPSKAAYKGLRICMKYLFHHTHLPIMYPNRQMNFNKIDNHSRVGIEEYKNNPTDKLAYDCYDIHDSDLARDI